MSNTIAPWLVVLPAGHWQVSGIRAAIEQGIQVLAFDGDPNAKGLEIATKSAVVNIKDSKAVLDAIESSGITPQGAVSFASEVGMPAVAAVREYYNLVGANTELTHLLTNKMYQRDFLQKKGVQGPKKWKIFTSLSMAKACIKDVGFPCIVKPVDSAGSRGVTKVETSDEVESAARHALEASQTGVALVETFMEGTEYAVETFGDGNTIHVLAVTEKKKVPGTKGTVAQELSTPSDETRSMIVSDITVAALQAFGYMNGPGHTEVILDKYNRPGLVETAGRGGGFMVFERMVEKASGFDIVTATALQSVGIMTPVHVKKKHSVVLRFIVSKEGVVRNISGIKEASTIPGVEVGSLVTVGQLVSNVQGDGDRLAYILSEGDTLKAAKSAANHAETLIEITVE